MTLPRGIRNCNPGNIRKSSDKWQGLADVQNDSEFFIFRSDLWGLRALARVLFNYQHKHNLDTIRKIISRWAPPIENNTEAYVRAVAQACGVGADEFVDVVKILPELMRAIIVHENGGAYRNYYADDLIRQAADMAVVR